MDKNNITVIYGKKPFEMTKKILGHIEPFSNLNLKKDALIGLKPNLVKASPSNEGATTSPEIVRGIIEHLQERGFFNIIILESAWLGDKTTKAFKVCGYEDISKDYGVPLFDLKADKTEKVRCSAELSMDICKKALQLDFLINIPVLKAHCQTKVTCALKNLKGCIPDSEKRRFHNLGLHKPIAYLNKALKTHLIIVDGIMGDLSHEEGGNPVEMGRIIAGCDPVLIDSYAAELLGLHVEDIPYITMAEKLVIGKLFRGKDIDRNRTTVTELDKDKMPRVTIHAGSLSAKLNNMVDEREACSPCYGNLIHALQRLKESGEIEKIPGKISIGQGFKELGHDGIGVGSCTSGMASNLPGCPPETKEMVEFLKK